MSAERRHQASRVNPNHMDEDFGDDELNELYNSLNGGDLSTSSSESKLGREDEEDEVPTLPLDIEHELGPVVGQIIFLTEVDKRFLSRHVILRCGEVR